jgi:enoyl-CoA hydratase/carnithine racemase
LRGRRGDGGGLPTCAWRANTAKIAFLFTKVGLCGADMGAAWLLPRIVGLGRASELLMLGDFISAQRAYEIGLYNEVCKPERARGARARVGAQARRGADHGPRGHEAHAQRRGPR